MIYSTKPIGVLDSGLGGINVLREIVKLMPHEDFIYFGDSKNAPYGIRPEEEILRLVTENVKLLIELGTKAIVIACNTATSVAADVLRETCPDVPIIGVEPAIKPAALHKSGSKILVMATPVTIKNERFKRLLNRFSDVSHIIPLPCPGLVEFVERGVIAGEELDSFLSNLLGPYKTEGIDSVVLGCTHYVFVKDAIRKAFGRNILIFDGARGTAAEARRRIEEKGIQNSPGNTGNITLLGILDSQKNLAEKFLYMEDFNNVY
jgi:glutamate racemase